MNKHKFIIDRLIIMLLNKGVRRGIGQIHPLKK